jgi:hypothetical protein
MCNVLLPPDVNPIAVNKYIYIYISKIDNGVVQESPPVIILVSVDV